MFVKHKNQQKFRDYYQYITIVLVNVDVQHIVFVT